MALNEHIEPLLSVVLDIVIALFEIVWDWELDVILQWDIFEDESLWRVECVIVGGFGIAAQHSIDSVVCDDILP